MKKLAGTLAAVLLSGAALAEDLPPAPAKAPAAAKDAEPSRGSEKKAKDPKDARKPAPKPGSASQKDAPCEPVKPCPIE